MASTLTWKDVAGYSGSSSDYSKHSRSSADDIQKNIKGFADALNAFAGRNQQRNLAQLELEKKAMDAEYKGEQDLIELQQAQFDDRRAFEGELAKEEFGREQSDIYNAAYSQGVNGGSYDDFVKSELVSGMSPRAQALVGAEAAKMFQAGTAERSRLNHEAEQERIARGQLAQGWARHNLEVLKYEEGKPEDLYKNLPNGDAAILREGDARVAKQIADANFSGYTPVDLSKIKGVDVTEVRQALAEVNQDRRQRGLPPVPDNVFNKVIADGANTSWWGWSTGGLKEVLNSAGAAIDQAEAAAKAWQGVRKDSINRGSLDPKILQDFSGSHANYGEHQR